MCEEPYRFVYLGVGGICSIATSIIISLSFQAATEESND